MNLKQIDNEYTLLKMLKDNPEMTQRELSKELGLSLGKTNYLIHALMDKGWVKLTNFRHSNNKIGYKNCRNCSGNSPCETLCYTS